MTCYVRRCEQASDLDREPCCIDLAKDLSHEGERSSVGNASHTVKHQPRAMLASSGDHAGDAAIVWLFAHVQGAGVRNDHNRTWLYTVCDNVEVLSAIRVCNDDIALYAVK